LSSKPQPGKNHPPANPKHVERDEHRPEKRHITNEPLRVETDFSPEVIKKYDAANKDAETREGKKNRLEIAALVGLGIYCILTFWQGYLTHEILRQTQRNFERDQAPVIWTSPQEPKIEVGKRLEWTIPFANYGRSPARHMQHCALLVIGPGGVDRLPNLAPPSAAACSGQRYRSDSVLPQGFPPDYVSGLSPDPLTAEQVAVINNTDGGLMVYGVISYDDSSGHSYESTFCYYHLITGATMHCEKYNDIREVK